jgi:hypothetical protein
VKRVWQIVERLENHGRVERDGEPPARLGPVALRESVRGSM